MPRLAIAIPADVRSAVFALLAQTGVGPAPSAEALKQELGELRSGLSDRDARLAQAVTDQAALAQQLQALRRALEDAQSREAQLVAERDTLHKAQAEAIAAAQERYEGMSRRLLEETAQQRQAAQAEVARMASQQKFADKRQAALETRLQHLEAELAQVQAQREQALGEASALRYVNTSQRTQIDEIVGLARGRQQPTKVTAAAAAKRVKSAVKGKGPST